MHYSYLTTVKCLLSPQETVTCAEPLPDHDEHYQLHNTIGICDFYILLYVFMYILVGSHQF